MPERYGSRWKSRVLLRIGNAGVGLYRDYRDSLEGHLMGKGKFGVAPAGYGRAVGQGRGVVGGLPGQPDRDRLLRQQFVAVGLQMARSRVSLAASTVEITLFSSRWATCSCGMHVMTCHD